MMPDSRLATAAPRSCTVWPLPLTSRLPLTAIENALVPELELELELAAVVLARVTVADVGEPRVAAPATETRLKPKCLLAPLALTGTTIVLGELSPSAQANMPLVG